MLIEGIVLLAILTLAAWLRFTGLDRTSLFGDEAVYSGQAAALAGNPASENNFGIFLAHPLLFYLLLAGGFDAGIPAEGGRVLTAVFGVASVGVAWALGRRVGGRFVGLAAAFLLAVLAYHAYISRLVELDGPAGFLIGCSLYAFVRAEQAQSASWLAAAAAVLGLAALTKETALVVLPAVALCAVVDDRLRMGLRAWLLAAVSFATVFAAFPVAVVLGGGVESALAYLDYQIGRQAQSSPLTYVELIDPYFGWLFVALVGLGILASLWARGAKRIVAIAFDTVLACEHVSSPAGQPCACSKACPGRGEIGGGTPISGRAVTRAKACRLIVGPSAGDEASRTGWYRHGRPG